MYHQIGNKKTAKYMVIGIRKIKIIIQKNKNKI